MTPKSELIALAERCEEASGADRELDADIAVSIRWSPPGIDERLFFNKEIRPLYVYRVPTYTGSVDAAIRLISGDCVWGVSNRDPDPQMFRAAVMPFMKTGESEAATPALALCAAALRARSEAL